MEIRKEQIEALIFDCTCEVLATEALREMLERGVNSAIQELDAESASSLSDGYRQQSYRLEVLKYKLDLFQEKINKLQSQNQGLRVDSFLSVMGDK